MTLYLGIDPRRFERPCVHYPMIRTEKLPVSLPPVPERKIRTLFTSRTAVCYWESSFEEAIAIGPGTAAALRERGVEPLVAKEATQEGVAELLSSLSWEKTFLLYPHAEKSRPLLRDFLRKRKIAHAAFVFYKTLFQALEPLPNLSDYGELVFTSPSTVDAFLHFFKTFPRHCLLTPIGPVTKRYLALNRFLQSREHSV